MLEESIRKDQISRNGILARLEKEKNCDLLHNYLIRLSSPWFAVCADGLFGENTEGHRRNRMQGGPKGAMDRAVALRRCSVTGYIPGIPRGHGHISSSSRFPVPCARSTTTIDHGTSRYTRNNSVWGKDVPRHTSEFPSLRFLWFTSTMRRSTDKRLEEEKFSRIRSIVRTFSPRASLLHCTNDHITVHWLLLSVQHYCHRGDSVTMISHRFHLNTILIPLSSCWSFCYQDCTSSYRFPIHSQNLKSSWTYSKLSLLIIALCLLSLLLFTRSRSPVCLFAITFAITENDEIESNPVNFSCSISINIS